MIERIEPMTRMTHGPLLVEDEIEAIARHHSDRLDYPTGHSPQPCLVAHNEHLVSRCDIQTLLNEIIYLRVELAKAKGDVR